MKLPAATRYAVFAQPTLILNHPDDPACRAARQFATLLPGAQVATRAASISDTCAAVCAFLDDAAPLPGETSRAGKYAR